MTGKATPNVVWLLYLHGVYSHDLHLGFPHGVVPLGYWVVSRDPFISTSLRLVLLE